MTTHFISSTPARWALAVCLLLFGLSGCKAGKPMKDLAGEGEPSSETPKEPDTPPAGPKAKKEEPSENDAPIVTEDSESREEKEAEPEKKAKEKAGKDKKIEKKKGSKKPAKNKQALLEDLVSKISHEQEDMFGIKETEAQKKKQKEKAWKCVARESKKAGFKGKYCDPKCRKCVKIHLKCEVFGKGLHGAVTTADEPDYCPK